MEILEKILKSQWFYFVVLIYIGLIIYRSVLPCQDLGFWLNCIIPAVDPCGDTLKHLVQILFFGFIIWFIVVFFKRK